LDTNDADDDKQESNAYEPPEASLGETDQERGGAAQLWLPTTEMTARKKAMRTNRRIRRSCDQSQHI
jgi:hypothetical protein